MTKKKKKRKKKKREQTKRELSALENHINPTYMKNDIPERQKWWNRARTVIREKDDRWTAGRTGVDGLREDRK